MNMKGDNVETYFAKEKKGDTEEMKADHKYMERERERERDANK
jgi:hypothetical protein